jgi:predicted Ser/Thr protein kinase
MNNRIKQFLIPYDSTAPAILSANERARYGVVYDIEGAYIYSFIKAKLFNRPGVRGGRVVKILGKGGMGRAYLITDTAGRQAVLKTSTLMADTVYFNQYKYTQTRLKQILHSGVCEKHGILCFYETEEEILRNNGQKLIVSYSLSNFIDGVYLDDVPIDTTGMFFRLLKQYIRAVMYMHSKGIVHYDLKGNNVMVDRNTGKLFIIDLDTAKFMDFENGVVDKAAVYTPSFFVGYPSRYKSGTIKQIPISVAKYMDYFAISKSFFARNFTVYRIRAMNTMVESVRGDVILVDVIRRLFKDMKRHNWENHITAILHIATRPGMYREMVRAGMNYQVVMNKAKTSGKYMTVR